MKYFVVTSDFDLIKKPDWFDDFRKKYDEPFKYHITLKTPTKILEKDIDLLKKDLEKILKRTKATTIRFNKLFINKKAVNGVCIMILAEKNDVLLSLQKEISNGLSKYGKHYLPEYEKYEKDQKLHITIARGLDDKKFKKALSELGDNFECLATIDKVTLTIVDSIKSRDVFDKKFKTIFKLN